MEISEKLLGVVMIVSAVFCFYVWGFIGGIIFLLSGYVLVIICYWGIYYLIKYVKSKFEKKK